MTFTYSWYKNLLLMLQSHGYECVNYSNWQDSKSEKVCILRHDIDNDVSHALELAQIESNVPHDKIYGGGGIFQHIFCSPFF